MAPSRYRVRRSAQGGRGRSYPHRLRHERVLLDLERVVRAGSRAREVAAADVVEVPRGAHAFDEAVEELLAHEAPAAHVARLFLRPHELRVPGVPAQDLPELASWERVELLEADDGDVALPRLVSRNHQLVQQLAARDDDAAAARRD